MNRPRAACSLAWLTIFSGIPSEGAGSVYLLSPRPELVSQLSKELSLKPTETVPGADTLFNLDESCFSHAGLVNVVVVVPSMSFLKAVPTNDHKMGSSYLNSLIPVAYREKWPIGLCQYSPSSFNGSAIMRPGVISS